jgi:hypothetical protein
MAVLSLEAAFKNVVFNNYSKIDTQNYTKNLTTSYTTNSTTNLTKNYTKNYTKKNAKLAVG